MGDLFPKPGEKPWNLDAFGQPRWQEPKVRRVLVERRPENLELELARFDAFHDRLATKLRELDKTHVIDPTSLVIETTTHEGNPVYRATYIAKPRTKEL
ncbi:hypothetical protein [Glutamicibacter sp. AOP5-A2-18]|uniref:hypothetical protein n=1 Tax=Glutamicibacter sp. AOP5-A2-18 TaxID=3457656 RepID=UPI004033C282